MDPHQIIRRKVSPLRQLYHKWRALRNVPFRKKYFVGYDLDGNTFWEFRNYNDPARMRRIVEYRIPNLAYVDYKLPPQWIQWLRHNRPTTPTVPELLADFQRQQALKGLVQQAEERWKSVPLKDTDNPEASGEQDKKEKQPEFQQPTRFSGQKDEFQPQSWTPPNPQRTTQEDSNNAEDSQPQSWNPTTSARPRR